MIFTPELIIVAIVMLYMICVATFISTNGRVGDRLFFKVVPFILCVPLVWVVRAPILALLSAG